MIRAFIANGCVFETVRLPGAASLTCAMSVADSACLDS